MTNNCWVLTKDLILSYKLRKKADIRDTFILAILSLLSGFLSIGSITTTDTAEKLNLSNGFTVGNLFVEFNTIPKLYVAIPLFAVFFIFLIAFFVCRLKETNIKPNKWMVSIGILLLIARIVGVFFFSPKGNFTYISPLDNSTVSLTYDGLSMQGKILEIISEFLFGSFFILIFTYIKTLSNYTLPIFKLALYTPIIVALVALIYSLIKEYNSWINNLLYLLKKVEEIDNIQSLTTHKNMFGFFLFLGTLSSLIFFYKHHNIIFYILSGIFLVGTVIILSKTSILLTFIVFFIVTIMYFSSYRKEHKINSIICLIVFILSIVVLVFAVYVFFKGGFLEKFKNHNTLSMRFDHVNIAAAMFKDQSILLYIFGYGKTPFTVLYERFETAINYEVLWTSHNSYMETLAHFGIIGLLTIILCDGYVLHQINYLVIKKKIKECAIYYPIFAILCAYSIFEPRMLFLLSSGTEVFLFYFILLFPVLLDSGHAKTNEVLI